MWWVSQAGGQPQSDPVGPHAGLPTPNTGGPQHCESHHRPHKLKQTVTFSQSTCSLGSMCCKWAGLEWSLWPGVASVVWGERAKEAGKGQRQEERLKRKGVNRQTSWNGCHGREAETGPCLRLLRFPQLAPKSKWKPLPLHPRRGSTLFSGWISLQVISL